MADEKEIRQGVREILGGAAKLAKLSDNTIDDTVIAAALQAVDNDLLWGWIYRALQLAIDDERIVESPRLAEEMKAEAKLVGIDPATLLAIIAAIAELINLFRNR